jgi:polyisoprenoid-binding protein YceI
VGLIRSGPARRCAFGLLLFVTASAAPVVHAQALVVSFDPARTQVRFTLGATLHTVEGTFKLKSGEMQVDATTGKASGTVVVDATSGETGNDSRDKNMHEKVLQSAKFSEIVFVPTQAAGDWKAGLAGDTTHALLTGTMKIDGQDHSVTVPLTLERKNGEETATATFTVPYVMWGLKDPGNAFLHVKDTVDVRIQAVLRVVAPPVAGR